MQVQELLKRRCFDQALDLIDLVLTTEAAAAASSSSNYLTPSHAPHTAAAAAYMDGSSSSSGVGMWPQVALAQAGQLLLCEGEVERGLAVLERCPPEVFQPCQLFYLFPEEMER
jgi:hypothetical protein